MINESLKDKAFKQIRSDIVSNVLAPGQPLNERVLSEQLEISKTPIREAIQLLYKEGFVQVIPQKGCFVSPITLNDIREIMQIREGLEPIAAGDAALKCDRQKLAMFEKEFNSLAKKPTDFQISSDLGKRFHNFLIESTRNQRLVELLSNINIHLDRIRAIFSVQYTADYDHQNQIFSEHLAILEAVREKNKINAEKRMREHILNFWEVLRAFI